jgi:hypothetical protein
VSALPQSTSKDADQKTHQICGTIQAIKGTQITLETRDKSTVEVDAAPAIKNFRSSVLTVGGTVMVQGAYDPKGVLHAESIQRAKSSPATWPADR